MIFGLFASNRPGNKGTITLFGITMAAIVLSIIMQFYVSETIGPPFTDTWRRGCPDDDFQSVCFATTSVLRVSAALVIFLALVLVGTFINAMFYDIFNIYKVFVFAAIVIGFMNMTSTSMLQYAWVRACACTCTALFFTLLHVVCAIRSIHLPHLPADHPHRLRVQLE